MLQTIVLFGHLAVALLIIGLVLLQRGKGADAGSGFGAGASGTVFGARGSASFFSRATAVLATLFFMTSLALAWLGGQTSEPTSILDSLDEPAGLGAEPLPAPDSGGVPQITELPPVPTDAADNGGESAAVESGAPGDEVPAVPETGEAAND